MCIRDRIWIRATDLVSDNQIMHRAILAFASDMALLSTCMQPHGVSWITRKMQSASLDHAIWFHRDLRADEWLLYSMDAPTSQASRGLSRGEIYSHSGELVASVVQESLMRDVGSRTD